MRPKIPYLDIFGLQFNKNYCQTFNQYTRICETIKFHQKQKKNKFGTKNALFENIFVICEISTLEFV